MRKLLKSSVVHIVESGIIAWSMGYTYEMKKIGREVIRRNTTVTRERHKEFISFVKLHKLKKGSL